MKNRTKQAEQTIRYSTQMQAAAAASAPVALQPVHLMSKLECGLELQASKSRLANIITGEIDLRRTGKLEELRERVRQVREFEQLQRLT